MVPAAVVTTARQPRRTPSSARRTAWQPRDLRKSRPPRRESLPLRSRWSGARRLTWHGSVLQLPPSARAPRQRGRRSRLHRYRRSVRPAPSSTRFQCWRSGSHKPALRLTALIVSLTRCLPASLIIGSFVHGTRLEIRPARTEGASRESRLDQTLKLGHETGRGQKTTRKQDLTPIRVQLPTARLHQRIRFC